MVIRCSVLTAKSYRTRRAHTQISSPVVVSVGSTVTSLGPLKIAAKLLCVQAKVINETSSLVKMTGE